MFRRQLKSLPADPQFGDTLEELGYFVNENDEIRAVDNPQAYFKYHINRNQRWNDRQRYHFNGAVEKLIQKRLEALGLERITLPKGTPIDRPHVPVMVSRNMERARYVVVVLQDPFNELGVLSQRVIGGVGGLERGSLAAAVRYLRDTQPDAAVVVTSPGQLWWWADHKRALTMSARESVPMRSAAHWGPVEPDHWSRLTAPRNRCEKDHIECLFDDILAPMKCAKSPIHVIGLGISSESGLAVLDRRWAGWKDCIKSFSIVGGASSHEFIGNFDLDQWMRKRCFAYTLCPEPVGTFLSGPDGNPNTCYYTGFGCPVFSAGEASLDELIFVKRYEFILDKIKEVVTEDAKPGGPGYQHVGLETSSYVDEMRAKLAAEASQDGTWKEWGGISSAEVWD